VLVLSYTRFVAKRNPKHLEHVAPKTHHKQKKKREPFDYVIYFFTIATPLSEIPQAITIYVHHAARDVSIWTWGFFLLDNVVWIIYGLRCKLKPVFITSLLYLVVELAIVVGVIHYS